MIAIEFDRILRTLDGHNPFETFTITLRSGRQSVVDRAGAMVVRDGVAVFLAPGGSPIWFNHNSILQISGADGDVQV